MVNYLLWDRWEPPSPPPIPPGTPKPEESGNSSSSSSTVSEDLWLLAPLSAAGKSTVKLANKNVWNRWLSAGEDMPGEINISARTTRKKGSCEEGKKKKKKGGTGRAAPPILRRDSVIFRRGIGAAQTVREQSCFSAPLSGETQPQIKPVAARVKRTWASVRGYTAHMCWSDLIPSVRLRCPPPPRPPPSRWKPGNTSLHFTWCSAVKFNFGEI